jgi:hypothetical protein
MPSMSMLKKLAKTIIARSQDSFLTMADSVSPSTLGRGQPMGEPDGPFSALGWLFGKV